MFFSCGIEENQQKMEDIEDQNIGLPFTTVSDYSSKEEVKKQV